MTTSPVTVATTVRWAASLRPRLTRSDPGLALDPELVRYSTAAFVAISAACVTGTFEPGEVRSASTLEDCIDVPPDSLALGLGKALKDLP